jgi:hypothetical protein
MNTVHFSTILVKVPKTNLITRTQANTYQTLCLKPCHSDDILCLSLLYFYTSCPIYQEYGFILSLNFVQYILQHNSTQDHLTLLGSLNFSIYFLFFKFCTMFRIGLLIFRKSTCQCFDYNDIESAN